jgi:hypothetical protein
MAIRRKDEKSKPQVPAEIEATVDQALEAAYLSDFFAGKKDELKAQAVSLIENDPRVELVIGEGFRTANGMIILSERKNAEVDAAALEAAIAAGHLNIADLLACVSTWKKDRLAEVIPGAVSFGDPTPSTTLRPAAHFKARMAEKHADLDAIWETLRAQVRNGAKQEAA